MDVMEGFFNQAREQIQYLVGLPVMMLGAMFFSPILERHWRQTVRDAAECLINKMARVDALSSAFHNRI